MKRNNFLTALFTLAAAPRLAWSHISKTYLQIKKGFKIQKGEGRIHGHIQLKGVNVNILDVKISGSDTNGNLAVFEQTSLSQGKGTPLHVHLTQDEIFYVLDGSYIFKVGEEKYQLSIGESIFLPRNIPHAWTQVSEKGKLTVIVQPAGKLEEFFVNMSTLDHEPTPAEVAKIFALNEMNVVGPPLKID